MVVSREDGDGHDGRREGGTEDEVDGGAAVLSVVCYVGSSRGYVWCLRRAGDRVVDDLYGIRSKVAGGLRMPVNL